MIKKRLLLCFLLLTGVAFGQAVKIPISTDIQIHNGKQFYVHTVRKGQTLYSIAKAYQVGLDEIYFANPETRQGIRTGQKIWIPTVNKETEINHEVKTTNFDFFYHVAAAGETLDHISSIYLIPKRYILLANPGIKSPLKEGEYVKIPVESAYPVLDGKVTGAAAHKSYSGGLQPQKPIVEPSDTTNTLAPASASEAVTGRSQPVTVPTARPAGSFNPNIPIIQDYRHVVIPGESLKSIAKKYGITKAELKAVNPGLISIFQGERLRLPVTAKVPGFHPSAQELRKARKYEPTPVTAAPDTHRSTKKTHPKLQHFRQQSFVTHIVKKKETLYSISRLYGLKPEDLYKANPGLTSTIRIGQSIRIPKKKISTDFVYYQARRKISLKKVARLYRVAVNMLIKNNPSVGRKVIPGQVVRIPVGPQALIMAKEQEKPKGKPSGEKTETGETTTPAAAFGSCKAQPHFRTFKVALMVPLYLEETDSINMTEFMIRQQQNFSPFRFIEFLEGALIASDSLREQGMNLKLYVYDVDQTLTKTSKVITRPELKEMNLIIGPFYSRSFNQVALFANHFGIPIVNPFTFRNDILSQYDNVVKVTPDKHVELSQVSHLIQNDYARDKVFVISQTSYKDSREVSALRDSIQKVLADSVYYPDFDLINIGIAVTQRYKNEQRLEKVKENPDEADTIPVTKITFNDTLNNYYLENYPINPESLKDFQYDTLSIPNRLIYTDYALDSLHPFKANASILRNNLVVLYGNNKSFIMDAMNRLNVLRDTFNIKIIGLPAWQTMGTLDLYQMDNMEVTYPDNYFVDYSSAEYKKFNNNFYNRYGTAPGRYGVLGFDITYYFLKSVFLYGDRFMHCLPFHINRGLSTQYKFKPVNPGSGNFENTYWNWLRIKGKQLIKLPDEMLERQETQEK